MQNNLQINCSIFNMSRMEDLIGKLFASCLMHGMQKTRSTPRWRARLSTVIMEVLLLQLLLLSVASYSREQNSNITLELPSDCQTLCGDIPIDYPFGVGDGCFRPGFNLTCILSNGVAAEAPPRLFLGDNSTEVRNISVLHYFMTSAAPVLITMAETEQSASASASALWTPVQVGSAAVFYGTDNYIYVAGCSVRASLIDLNNGSATIGACSSVCNATTSSEDACDGNGCCFIGQGDPTELAAVGLQLTRLEDQNPTVVRAFATINSELTRKEIMEFDETTVVEINMQWSITDQPSCEEAMKNEETYACLGNRRYGCRNSSTYGGLVEVSGYSCHCIANLGSNPYLLQGCEEEPIDASLPEPNCSTKCGAVDVPFPFGLEQGCYRDENFAFDCSETDNDSLYVVNNIYWSGDIVQFQVVNISIDEGQLTVKSSPRSTCHSTYEIGLSGNFGFLEDRGYSLEWVVAYESCQEAQMNQTSFACRSRSSLCLDTPIDGFYGHRCECAEGFSGNPYLTDGCQDINECDNPEKYPCGAICKNTVGNYTCICPPGTQGDPMYGLCIPEKKSDVLKGIIIGVSAGSGTILLVVSFAFVTRTWKKRNQKKSRQKFFHQNRGLLLEQLISSKEDIAQKIKIFSLEDLEKATNNFDESRVLGRGGHGMVYKGILSDQRIVAIKKSKIVNRMEIDQFINEVAILSQINHRNVVKIFGCCLETEVPLLVYEFISNGTLSDHLHARDSTLSWDERLRIATEAAGAIAYLHSAASVSIFHRDIKTSNILLDDYFTAKVSDFGASKSIPLDETRVVTAVQGTFGYLDPAYYRTGQLTEKSDVYSFGVILLEILTRKKPFLTDEHGEQNNLIMNFLQAKKHNSIFQMLEACVLNEAMKEELDEVIWLVAMCLNLSRDARPTMKEVEHRLRSLRKKNRKIREENA